MRAVKISKELGLNSSVVSTGLEFENIDELVQHNPTLIVPVNFPKAYDLTDLNIVEKLTLQQLRRWNQAPSNLSVLEKNNIFEMQQCLNQKIISTLSLDLSKLRKAA